DPALGETAGPHVVAEGDGDAAEALGEQLAKGQIAPAEVGGVHGDALPFVDDAGYGDTGRARGLAEVLLAVRAQVGGEVEHGVGDGVRAAVAAGGPARLVEQLAVRPDQGGFHPGAAHIQGDDVSHG